MAKLIIIVEMPDQDPTRVDPHEAAADVLYHYEAHREFNQDDPALTFVDAKWAENLLAERLQFQVEPDGE